VTAKVKHEVNRFIFAKVILKIKLARFYGSPVQCFIVLQSVHLGLCANNFLNYYYYYYFLIVFYYLSVNEVVYK